MAAGQDIDWTFSFDEDELPPTTRYLYQRNLIDDEEKHLADDYLKLKRQQGWIAQEEDEPNRTYTYEDRGEVVTSRHFPETIIKKLFN